MTYIELINRFWDFYRVKKFADIDTTIYFFLLNECNIRRWLNPFELQTRNLEIVLQISRKTIGEARNRLKQRGIIDFIEAQGRGPTIYRIEDVEVTNELLNKAFCVSGCVSPRKHEGNTTGNTRVTQRLHKGNTTPNSTLLYEEKRIKTKDSNSSAIREEHSTDESSLFAEEEKRTVRRKSKAANGPPHEPPTLEEVRQHFLSVGADKRLVNWEESCRRFYDNFTAVGWRDKFNRRIIHWDSRANSWIFDDEKRQTTQQNELTTITRPNPPTDDRERRQIDIANYVARNIGTNNGAPGCDGDNPAF